MFCAGETLQPSYLHSARSVRLSSGVRRRVADKHMKTDSTKSDEIREAMFVRIGGLLGFLLLGIILVINFVLLEPPAGGGAAPAEPKSYIVEHAGRMAIANGLRNLMFFCLLFWAAGLYTFTRRGATLATNAWGLLGLLGAAAAATMGIIANGVETVIFLNYGGVSEQRDVFLLLWSVTGVLYVVPQVGTAAMAAGFSLAGWRSGALPRWLVAVGLLVTAASLLTCVGIVSVMTGGWAGMAQSVGVLLTLVWMLSISVLMVRRASA